MAAEKCEVGWLPATAAAVAGGTSATVAGIMNPGIGSASGTSATVHSIMNPTSPFGPR